MVMKTLKLGFRVAEVPSHEHRREHGTSHIRLLRVWPRYLYVLVRDLI
jgi:hypothetical protein